MKTYSTDTPFIGREPELKRLRDLFNRRNASLVVVRGRRRIGKSRLLKEFAKELKSYFFSGLAPIKGKKINAQTQRQEFVNQLQQQGIPGINPEDWSHIFWHLAQYTREGRMLIVLDEISWMGGKDPNFLTKLRNAWELHFNNNPQLIVILCGSISWWIEENILSSTGYLGRVCLDLVIEELPLHSCNAFWEPNVNRISAYEKFKVLSVTGGVPLYLEQIRPEMTAEQNIQALCFMKGGLLVNEFEQIFSDLFSRRSRTYKEIVSCLAEGAKSLPEITKMLKRKKGGTYSKYLDHLVKAGYVQRDFTWQVASGAVAKQSRFRLSDNYLRFYLKYILSYKLRIDSGSFAAPALPSLPGWESITGLQFENLVVHNRSVLWTLLNIPPQDIVMDGPFLQTATQKHPGCQIDYLIQTRFQTLYLCEIKFSIDPVDMKIIEEMEEKRRRLSVPKYFSIRPVLIHVNGAQSRVIDSRYFDKIISFINILK